MDSPFLHKVHNFSIEKKNGKRGILQLDFPSKTLYHIIRGNIKRCSSFNELQQFDSEEGLQITVRFKDGDLDFDADNMEEKYMICRLLGIILDSGMAEGDSHEVILRNSSPLTPSASHPDKVIKEGVLEKKGNTTITIWNKRRVRVTPGEFSYYKPGVAMALNIVQLREDSCVINRQGQNGFTVTVKDRVFSFRCSDAKGTGDLEREEWIQAFKNAAKTRRNTLLYLDSRFKEGGALFEFPDDLLDQPFPAPNGQTPSGQAGFFNLAQDDVTGNKSPSAQRPSPAPRNTLLGSLKGPRTQEEVPKAEPPPDYDQKTRPPLVRGNSEGGPLRSPLTRQDTPIEGLPPPSPVVPPAPLLNAKNAGVKVSSTPRGKTKQVHWMKVTGDALDKSFWKGARDVLERLDLADLEEMFAVREREPKPIIPAAVPSAKKSRELLLDAKRAQNIGIIINNMKTTALEKLKAALNSTTELETFTEEQLTSIRRYQPDEDDVEMYRSYTGLHEELCPVDQFMLGLCEIPLLGQRLDLVLSVLGFPRQMAVLQEEVEVLVSACREVRECSALMSVMEYILAIGNFLNANTTGGIGAAGFQITSIDRVLDMRGQDNKSSLLHYLLEQLRHNEPGLVTWTVQLPHVPSCADVSIKAIEAEIEVMRNTLTKIKRTLKTLKSHLALNTKEDKVFQAEVQSFVTEYDRHIYTLITRCSQLKDIFRKTLEYFGEKPTQTSDVFFSSLTHFINKFQDTKGAVNKMANAS